jgi:hypothetical protein
MFDEPLSCPLSQYSCALGAGPRIEQWAYLAGGRRAIQGVSDKSGILKLFLEISQHSWKSSDFTKLKKITEGC